MYLHIFILMCLDTLIVAMQTPAADSKFIFNTLSNVYLPYAYAPDALFGLGEDAAEQLSFDPTSKLIYAVGNTNIHVLDMADVTNLTVLFHQSYTSVAITDVHVCGGHVFVAIDNTTRHEDGCVNVYKLYNKETQTLDLVHSIKVGTLPDMVLTTPDCKTLIVAIEAEPYDDNANAVLVDNPGGIGLVKFPQGPNGAYTINVLGFHSFDDRYFTELESQGVMYINRNAKFSDDVEPEYITLNTEGTLAYVSLQENNGIAVVDLASEEIVDIFGLGFKDWTLANIDPSDRDGGVHMQPWKVFGMYQPDAIKMLRFQNEDFIVTANEGDSKDYDYFSEENRVGDFVLSELFERNATLRDEWTTDSVLGRLKVTSVKGKNETTQQYDQLYSFGGRGFSIRRASDMSLVYDSGDEIATKTAELLPHLFNANGEESIAVSDCSDTRSDDKGPETESIAIGHIGDTTLLFIGNERGSTIAVYNLDQTAAEITPQFETFIYGVGDSDETRGDLYTARDISMVDPEDITFITANDSPNGKPLLLVSGSVSGTVTVLQMDIQLGLPNAASAHSRIFKSSLSVTGAWITCYLFQVLLH